jgi:hypothetical protein
MHTDDTPRAARAAKGSAMSSCLHLAPHLRSAIGPASGILCGLCGQDVPTPLALSSLLAEIGALCERNQALTNALCKFTGADCCTSCGVFLPKENLFRGIKSGDRRMTLCTCCLACWFDNEDGNLEDLHVPYLVSFMLSMDIRPSHEKHGRLADMAHQAFPQLAGEIRKRMG